MAWRMAKSLDALLKQVNAQYPGRNKAWDGGIGDANHSARTSDHNPDTDGVVKARDITNDPSHGLVSESLAEMLRASRDERIKYIISNRKICAGSDGPTPWQWRKYNGANPHDHHVHVSVKRAKGFYDDTSPWNISSAQPVAVAGDGHVDDENDVGDVIDDGGNETPPAKTDKTVKVLRGTGIGGGLTTLGLGLAGKAASDGDDMVEKVTTIADKSGQVVGVVKQAVAVPKPGFWEGLFHYTSTAGFWMAIVAIILFSWGGILLWQWIQKNKAVK